jgi:hypothetical protein
MNNKNRYPCPCCGFLTLTEQPPGTFEVCPVCYWEDDNVQFADPEYSGGANGISLTQARHNFAILGAISQEHVNMTRQPLPEEIPSGKHSNGA